MNFLRASKVYLFDFSLFKLHDNYISDCSNLVWFTSHANLPRYLKHYQSSTVLRTWILQSVWHFSWHFQAWQKYKFCISCNRWNGKTRPLSWLCKWRLPILWLDEHCKSLDVIWRAFSLQTSLKKGERWDKSRFSLNFYL